MTPRPVEQMEHKHQSAANSEAQRPTPASRIGSMAIKLWTSLFPPHKRGVSPDGHTPEPAAKKNVAEPIIVPHESGKVQVIFPWDDVASLPKDWGPGPNRVIRMGGSSRVAVLPVDLDNPERTTRAYEALQHARANFPLPGDNTQPQDF